MTHCLKAFYENNWSSTSNQNEIKHKISKITAFNEGQNEMSIKIARI